MDKEFEFIDAFGDKEILKLEVSYYTTNKRLYIGLTSETEGFSEPYANLTVNINGACPEYCGYVDTSHFPDAERLIQENGLGEFTGLVGHSGFCNYPLYLFDCEKLREYAPEGMARYEAEALGIKKEKQMEKGQVR